MRSEIEPQWSVIRGEGFMAKFYPLEWPRELWRNERKVDLTIGLVRWKCISIIFRLYNLAPRLLEQAERATVRSIIEIAQ